MTDKRVPRHEPTWEQPITLERCELPQARGLWIDEAGNCYRLHAPAAPDEPVPLSEWQQLVAERDALKAALRKVALRSNDRGNWCECCDGSWLGLSPERHAPGCLAAPEKDAP